MRKIMAGDLADWRTDYFSQSRIKRSQPAAAPTRERISNVGAAEGCDLLLFAICYLFGADPIIHTNPLAFARS
jgi:hypothetical protein